MLNKMANDIINAIEKDIKQLIKYINKESSHQTVLPSFKMLSNSEPNVQIKVYKYIIRSIMELGETKKIDIPIETILTFYTTLIKQIDVQLKCYRPTYIPGTKYFMFLNLGSGVSSTVRLTLNIETMKKCAVKHISYDTMSDVMKSYIQNEIKIMNMCDHPHIIKCEKIIYTFLSSLSDIETKETNDSEIPINTKNIYIVMRNADYGDCFAFMRFLNFTKKNNIAVNPITFIEHFVTFSSIVEQDVYSNIPLYGIHKLLNQLVDAFLYLEENNLMHRDIKPSNILVIEDKNDIDFPFSFLLCDFTMAKKLTDKEEELQSTVGTILFMSPEKLQKQKYDNKSESWSLGTTLSIFYFGALPADYKKKVSDETIKKFIIDNMYQIKEKTKELPTQIENYYLNVTQKTLMNLLKVDKKQRMTINQLKESPYMNIDIQGLLSSSFERKYYALLDFFNSNQSSLSMIEMNSIDSSFLRKFSSIEDENKKLKSELNEIKKKLKEYKSHNELIQNLYNYEKIFGHKVKKNL